jgi:hypothetical protein
MTALVRVASAIRSDFAARLNAFADASLATAMYRSSAMQAPCGRFAAIASAAVYSCDLTAGPSVGC